MNRLLSLVHLIGMLALCLAVCGAAPVHAQGNELVASLEILNATVSIKRANTDEWVKVLKESLVGVGDVIRTDKSGRARVTFFANGTDTTIQPGTELRIDDFSGSEQQYKIALTVLVGQTTQRIAQLLDSGSSYTINSTGLELAVRGTSFLVRVEPTGRSSMIVTTGLVATKGKAITATPGPGTGPIATTAEVPAGFGIRGEAGKGLSDVVRATSFELLDSALDGCAALIDTLGRVNLNVRTGPGLNFPRVGQQSNLIVLRVLGITETTKWYRIAFKGGYAWVFAPALQLDKTCPGLRRFPDTYGPEDVTRYSGLEPAFVAELNAGLTATPTAPTSTTATATATPPPATPTAAP
jgi:hypothetical protein